MNPVLAQWLPVIVMIIAMQAGLLYSNKRLGEVESLLRSEFAGFKVELRQEIAEMKLEIRAEIQQSEQRILAAIAELKAELQNLDRRVQRLEAPLLRT